MANELHCPECRRLVPYTAVFMLGLALIARCPSCGHEWGANAQWTKAEKEPPPRPAIVTLYPDGDAWLKTPRGRR